MKITIFSSMSKPEFASSVLKIAQDLENAGHQVTIPFETQDVLHGKMDNNREDVEVSRKTRLEFFDIIKASDAVLVTNREKNGIAGYIGGSVLIEMAIAFANGKDMYILYPLPEISTMRYVQEINLMKPIILHGDVTKIQ